MAVLKRQLVAAVLLRRADCPLSCSGRPLAQQTPSERSRTAAASPGGKGRQATPRQRRAAGLGRKALLRPAAHRRSFKRLEDLLLRMGEVNGPPTPAARPAEKGRRGGKKREMDLQFKGTVDLLKRTNFPAPWKTRRKSSKTSKPSSNSCKARTRRNSPGGGKASDPRIPQSHQRNHPAAEGRAGRTGDGDNMKRLPGDRQGIAEKTGKLANDMKADDAKEGDKKARQEGQGGAGRRRQRTRVKEDAKQGRG